MKKPQEDWVFNRDLEYNPKNDRPQYKGADFSGTTYFLYENSQAVSKTIEFQQGNQTGIYQEYYPDGYLKAWGKYDQGQKTERWEYYDEEANLIKTERYRPPYGLLKSKIWSADLQLGYRLDRHHFGEKAVEYFQLEQKFDEQGQLRQEKALEYGILVAEGNWDEAGNLVSSFILQEGGPHYDQWAAYHAAYSAVNPYELSF